MRTKATKFSSLFSTAPNTENTPDVRQVLKRDRYVEIDVIDEDDYLFDAICQTTPEEIADYIVENPAEVVVDFPIASKVQMETKLPFFKSITYKLAHV